MSAADHLQPQQMSLFMPQMPEHTWVDDAQNDAFAQRLTQSHAASDQSTRFGRMKTSLLNRQHKTWDSGD